MLVQVVVDTSGGCGGYVVDLGPEGQVVQIKYAAITID
jgi:hypothetical protein